MREVLDMTALEIAALIASRELSSREVTQFFFDRIDAYDDRLQSFVSLMRRRALWSADDKDRSTPNGAFHGVPIGIKDLVPVFAAPLKLGSRAYRYFFSPFTARAARLLSASGFVTLGKTSTSEFGVLPITEPDIHPPTRNPWNTAHTSGGSSGGAGTSVAAGLVPIAQGSDGGGSVRIPAAFCHLYGFKPSLSLLGNLHGKVNRLGLSVMGPLTHDVSDAAAMLDALRDDRSGRLLEVTQRAPRKLRIRFTVESPIGDVEPEIADATLRAAKVLADLGHDVAEVDMIEANLDDFLPLWQLNLAGIPVTYEGWLQPITQWLREEGRRRRLEDVQTLQRELIARFDGMFGDADVLLSPTVPVFPPRVGQHAGLPPREMFEAIAPIGGYTAPYNLSWRPAASIPAGINADGLPYGIQLGGRLDEDELILQLSRQLEEAMPWRMRGRPKSYD